MLPDPTTQVRDARTTYRIASEKYNRYIKQSNRNASGIRAAMREVIERGHTVAKVRNQMDAMNRNVDNIIKKLSPVHLGPCLALVAQVINKVPRELKGDMYMDLQPCFAINSAQYCNALL
jgi:hypothetical protein